ncbi:MAG TPA: glycosyl hydrolase family 28 protein [Bryobacteraceae bacterium]
MPALRRAGRLRQLQQLHDVFLENLTIRSTGGNGDGIDIDSCKHVRIGRCDIATGDDCIAIKSGRGSEAYALLKTTEDVVISNCTLAGSIFGASASAARPRAAFAEFGSNIANSRMPRPLRFTSKVVQVAGHSSRTSRPTI